MDSVGGGVVTEIVRHPYSVGGGDRVGGGSTRHFPGSIFCGGGVPHFYLFPLAPVTDPQFVFFQLIAVTDPKFVLFKHVLCFARMMSTHCTNSCRQTARIGGGQLPTCPPSRTPMGLRVYLVRCCSACMYTINIIYVDSIHCICGPLRLGECSNTFYTISNFILAGKY